MAAETNVTRALRYALALMGEVPTFSADGTTVSTVKDNDRKTAVLSSVSLAAAKTHVIAVHPQINSIVG